MGADVTFVPRVHASQLRAHCGRLGLRTDDPLKVTCRMCMRNMLALRTPEARLAYDRMFPAGARAPVQQHPLASETPVHSHSLSEPPKEE